MLLLSISLNQIQLLLCYIMTKCSRWNNFTWFFVTDFFKKHWVYFYECSVEVFWCFGKSRSPSSRLLEEKSKVFWDFTYWIYIKNRKNPRKEEEHWNFHICSSIKSLNLRSNKFCFKILLTFEDATFKTTKKPTQNYEFELLQIDLY